MKSFIDELIHIVWSRFPHERRLFIVLVFSGLCLIGRQIGSEYLNTLFISHHPIIDSITRGCNRFFNGDSANLPWLLCWAGVQLVFLLIIPALFLAFVRPSAFQMFRFPAFKKSKIYLFFFLGMLPVLVAVSFMDSFQESYPFLTVGHDEFNWKLFLFWEFIYALQFIAVEFFFRGFLIIAMLPVFGEAALAVSILPYVMIHFGKPYPEIFGALLAGWILGKAALKTNSISPGILVHFGIALSMDCLAMMHKF